MDKLKRIIEYLRQPSTWKGICMVLGAAGITVSPDLQNAILAGMLIVLGLVDIVQDEGKPS